jgi:hypothetical protein
MHNHKNGLSFDLITSLRIAFNFINVLILIPTTYPLATKLHEVLHSCQNLSYTPTQEIDTPLKWNLSIMVKNITTINSSDKPRIWRVITPV